MTGRYVRIDENTYQLIKNGAKSEGVSMGRFVSRLLLARWVLSDLRDKVISRAEGERQNEQIPVNTLP